MWLHCLSCSVNNVEKVTKWGITDAQQIRPIFLSVKRIKNELSNHVLVYPVMCTGDLLETKFFHLEQVVFSKTFHNASTNVSRTNRCISRNFCMHKEIQESLKFRGSFWIGVVIVLSLESLFTVMSLSINQITGFLNQL